MSRVLVATLLGCYSIGLVGQDRLSALSVSASQVESGIQGNFTELVQLSMDVTGVEAVMLMAGFDTWYGDAVNSREGMYKISSGSAESETVMQTLRKSGARDKQIGTLVHIFDASGVSGQATYTLQHASRVRQPVRSSATMVAIPLTTSETGITLPYGLRRITSPVYTTGTLNTWSEVTGLRTGRIILPGPGDIFVAASLNSVSDNPAAGEWKLQVSQDQSSWVDLGASARRSFTSDDQYGLSALSWIVRDLAEGDYYFRVLHRQTEGTGGDVRTLTSSLAALGLVYADAGGMIRGFPSFSQQNSESSTSGTSMTAAINTSFAPSDPADLFLIAQYVMAADGIADAAAYDLSVDPVILDGADQQQFLATSSEEASGGGVGLASGLQPGSTYTASLRHQSVSGVTLHTYNSTLSGFQLISTGACRWTGAGTAPTGWENSDNWSGPVPGNQDVAIIPGGLSSYPVLVAGTSCQDLTIESGGSLVIEPFASLTLSGSLVNDGSLAVHSDASGSGSLIVEGEASGNITCTSYLTADQWHIVSPPVSGQPVAAFLLNSDNQVPKNRDGYFGLTDYNEETNSWNGYFNESYSGDFATGKGYLLRRDLVDGPVSYTGTLADNDVQITTTSLGKGWNAVGNPYSSAIGVTSDAITAENFLNANISLLDPSYSALYIWDEAPGYTGTQNNFKVIGNAGYIDLDNHPELDLDYLQAGQGFLVKVKQGVPFLTFSRSMQIHQNALGLLKTAAVPWDGFRLAARLADREESATICFNEEMTPGLDPSYDAGLLNSNPGFSVYTRLVEGDQGTRFKIQSLPDHWEDSVLIPVGIYSETGGVVRVFTKGVRMPESTRILLEDRILNLTTDLTDEGSYYEAVLNGDTLEADRFFLHVYEQHAISGFQEPSLVRSVTAWYHYPNICLQGSLEKGTMVYLYDIRGRLRSSHMLEDGSRQEIAADGLENGIYLMLVINNSGRNTFKILISD
jgi:hypothetical protein